MPGRFGIDGRCIQTRWVKVEGDFLQVRLWSLDQVQPAATGRVEPAFTRSRLRDSPEGGGHRSRELPSYGRAHVVPLIQTRKPEPDPGCSTLDRDVYGVRTGLFLWVEVVPIREYGDQNLSLIHI